LDATSVVGLLLFVITAIVVFAVYNIVIVELLQKTVEPLVRWVQRILFGIDRNRTGDEALIGSHAVAGRFSETEHGEFIGSVTAAGEAWSARSEAPVKEGSAVLIIDRKNLQLVIEPLEND